jgi:hypothetical protein
MIKQHPSAKKSFVKDHQLYIEGLNVYKYQNNQKQQKIDIVDQKINEELKLPKIPNIQMIKQHHSAKKSFVKDIELNNKNTQQVLMAK